MMRLRCGLCETKGRALRGAARWRGTGVLAGGGADEVFAGYFVGLDWA